MDLAKMPEVTNDKLTQALHLVNQQLAESNSKLKKELYLSERRFNVINDQFLCSRQENKAMRDMVRKLKDQLTMVTQAIVSVQSQSEQMFAVINRPHAEAEDDEQSRESRAQQIFERMKTERRYTNSMAILEEDEQGESDGLEESKHTTVDMDVSLTPPAMRILSASGCEQLLPNSPLVHRLKRRSRNASFDESFETIERERAFKLSRVSRERRQSSTGSTDEPDTLREAGSSPLEMDRSNTLLARERSDHRHDISDMDVEDTIRASLQNISPARSDGHNSSKSVSTQTEQYTLRYDISSNPDRYVLKKVASESMLSTLDRATATVSESSESSFEDTTEIGPEDTIANASCSTPVTKGNALANASSNRNRPLAAAQKLMKSDTSLNRIRRPVVVLRPLTEDNIRSLERGAEDGTVERIRRGRPGKTGQQETSNEYFPGSSVWSGTNLEPSSSTENLSVTSNESSRPRRKAAPKTLREYSLRTKLRRE